MDKEWGEMSRAERSAFVAASIEQGYQREYENALAVAGREGPAWADLPEETRKRIRGVTDEHRAEMQAFGESLGKAARTPSSTPAAEGG